MTAQIATPKTTTVNVKSERMLALWTEARSYGLRTLKGIAAKRAEAAQGVQTKNKMDKTQSRRANTSKTRRTLATLAFSCVHSTRYQRYQRGYVAKLTWTDAFIYVRRDKLTKLVESKQVEKTFEISLDFKETKLRDAVKSLGGKWNPDAKTWTIICKMHQLVKKGLDAKIVATTNKQVISGKNDWLVNDKKVTNHLNYEEMWNRYGTDFE